MELLIKYITATYLVILSFVCISQSDTTIHNNERYSIAKHYPFYRSCSNCKIEENRPRMLCGHDYTALFTSYSFDGNHWTEVGIAKDKTSCFPDKGGHYLSISYSVLLDEDFVNSFNIKYLRDHLFGVQFYFIKYGVNLESMTDYSETDFIVGPEIRISDNMDYSHLLRKLNISYRYNIKLSDNLIGLRNFHQISIILKLIESGRIS